MDTAVALLLLPNFNIPENSYSLEVLPSGYIHTSFKVLQNGEPKYVLQKLSKDVFPEPQILFHNFNLAAPFLSSSDYSSFQWVLSRQGNSTYVDENGRTWRLLSFVPNSRSLERIENKKQVLECGRILGIFHLLLDTSPIAEFQIPIPGFHDLGSRLSAYREAQLIGLEERITITSDLQDTIDFLAGFLQSNKPATSPIRICHNDTKLSNLLFHTENDTALCLVDLDTLMPGYFYYDFGDLSRTVLDPKDEESREPLREKLDLSLLRALLNGVESSGVHLTKTEKDSLAYGMVLMPFLHGIRGLTDYLLGDPYYQVRYPDQNLIRAQNLISYARLVQKGFLPVQEMIKSELGAT